ncbi:MAG TPA: erythromycin esterase family protein [Chitinophagaceae bacterium]|nr:erythromycin esterase family protein [Chitinophagaceae bacterium]
MLVVSHEIQMKCLPVILLIAFSLHYQNLKSQQPVSSVAVQCIENNSFSFDPNGDPKNFNFLKSSVANKRIVILSEADCGDGTSYQVMSQMMQFLIDSLGFKVVAFDNSNVDINYFQNKIGQTDSISAFDTYFGPNILNAGYGFNIVPFLQTRIKEKKLELFGLDFQLRLDSAVNNLLKESCNFLQCDDSVMNRTFVSLLHNLNQFGNKAFLVDSYAKILSEKIDFLIAAMNKTRSQNVKEAHAMIQQWTNVKYFVTWLNRRFSFVNEAEDIKVTASYWAARDSTMAENLVWMLNFLYPREKIIINVSAYHASRFCYKIEGFSECCKPVDVKTFGELMAETPFKDDIYSIVFVSSGGFRGIEQNEMKKLPAPKKNSIEYVFSKTKFDYAFLDFKKNKCDWLNQGIFMAPFFDRYFLANWSDIFSGIVYIRDMKPNYSFR